MASPSADRRVITIGAVSMVVFLLIGVGSAAVFARPACRLVAPTVNTNAVAYDLDLEPAVRRLVDELDVFATVAVMPAEGIRQLVPFGDGVAAIGSRIVSFDATLRPYATVTFRNATVVGSGPVLYALNVTNDTTGQVDALQPIDDTLTARTCVELALVSTPLAFLRDAADGDVLLLRADEDGEDPFVELRDPDVGRRLELPVELAVGSAGQHGLRTSGVLLRDQVAFAQQLSAGAGEDTALWMFDRDSGAPVSTLAAATIRAAAGFNDDTDVSLTLSRDDDQLVVTVNGTYRFTVAPDTGVLAAYTSPQQRLPGTYAGVQAVLAAQFDAWSWQAHPAGGVLLVDTGTQQLLISVDDQEK